MQIHLIAVALAIAAYAPSALAGAAPTDNRPTAYLAKLRPSEYEGDGIENDG